MAFNTVIENKYVSRILNNPLFKDSFWAVGGNGLGNALMLLSGIIIARMLGKDLYGEYGMVKTSMFYLAIFSTFSLGDTSTKYVAEYLQKDSTAIRSIIKSSFEISLITSSSICFLMIVFAERLAVFVNTPQLATAFRFIGCVIVFRSLSTVGAGVLGGLKEYKILGRNNVISGVFMFVLCIPLTYQWGLMGSLFTLLLSQCVLAIINTISVYNKYKTYPVVEHRGFGKQMVIFSYPFAINELLFALSSWGVNILLAKYATTGDLGMYTACSQWNAIILFMPGLLGNVILSYLSTSFVEKSQNHSRIINRMLMVNFVCTIIPFLLVVAFSKYIVGYYGPSFAGMEMVLFIMIWGTIFICFTRVFQSNLMSEGKKWVAFVIRSSYNVLSVLLVYVVLKWTNGKDAALNMAYISLFINFIGFLMYFIAYKYEVRKSCSKC